MYLMARVILSALGPAPLELYSASSWMVSDTVFKAGASLHLFLPTGLTWCLASGRCSENVNHLPFESYSNDPTSGFLPALDRKTSI